MQIPIIDFKPFIVGDTAARIAVADQISRAVHEFGFFYLKNYDLPKTLVTQAFAQAKWFFALPQEEKNQLAWQKYTTAGGYEGLQQQKFTSSADLKEGFSFSREFDSNELGAASDHLLDAPNEWSQSQTEFREVLLQFFDACQQATSSVLQAFALALKLPESYFTNFHTSNNFGMRLHHYPVLSQPPEPGQIRCGEHSDFNSVSLLFQDEVEGLEICTTRGEWIAAVFIPDTVLVLVGDMIERWTNDKFPATVHRVSIPANFRTAKPRYSIGFFANPNLDADITCIESCLGVNESPKYPPFKAGEYLKQKYWETYKHLQLKNAPSLGRITKQINK